MLRSSSEEEGERQAKLLMQHYQDENPGAEQCVTLDGPWSMAKTTVGCLKSQRTSPTFQTLTPSTKPSPRSFKIMARLTTSSHPLVSQKTLMPSNIHSSGLRSSGELTSMERTCSLQQWLDILWSERREAAWS